MKKLIAVCAALCPLALSLVFLGGFFSQKMQRV